MITLDIKFPQSNTKSYEANFIYTITKSYYDGSTVQEQIVDSISEELKSKGKYTSKLKSDKNGGFTEPIEVIDGHITKRLHYPLVLLRKELYNGYYGFSFNGRVNIQDSLQKYVKNGKIKTNSKIVRFEYPNQTGQEYEIPSISSYGELDKKIAEGVPFIVKNLRVSFNKEHIFFMGDIYVQNITDFIELYLSAEYEGDTYHFETYTTPNISMMGQNLNFVCIHFSSDNYSYPESIKYEYIDTSNNSATVVSKTIMLNNQIAVLNSTPDNQYFYITINKWNKPNSEISITDIFSDEININRRNLISAESNISYRADKKMPSFGILSNTGNLEFNDIDGRIKLFAENNMLKSDVQVQLFLRNTLTNTEEQIGDFYTDVWNYDNDNRQVSVSLKDGLEELQDITPNIKIEYNPRYPAKRSLKTIYNRLHEVTPPKYLFLLFDNLDNKTQDILSNTIITYRFLETGNLWQMWNKLCEVAGLYIYKDNRGITRCSYTYGS